MTLSTVTRGRAGGTGGWRSAAALQGHVLESHPVRKVQRGEWGLQSRVRCGWRGHSPEWGARPSELTLRGSRGMRWDSTSRSGPRALPCSGERGGRAGRCSGCFWVVQGGVGGGRSSALLRAAWTRALQGCTALRWLTVARLSPVTLHGSDLREPLLQDTPAMTSRRRPRTGPLT